MSERVLEDLGLVELKLKITISEEDYQEGRRHFAKCAGIKLIATFFFEDDVYSLLPQITMRWGKWILDKTSADNFLASYLVSQSLFGINLRHFIACITWIIIQAECDSAIKVSSQYFNARFSLIILFK